MHLPFSEPTQKCLQLKEVVFAVLQGFGVGVTAVGITMSVYAGARLVMNLPAGLLADQRGRKPLLVWGPAITALGVDFILSPTQY